MSVSCSLLSSAFGNEPADESPTIDDEEAAGIYLRRESAVSTHNEGKPWKEEYVPVNAIPDEVYALFAAWEASSLTSIDSSDRMDIEEASNPLSANMLGPAQSLKKCAPPKRYSRTFWRSTSRRILEMSRAQSLGDDLQASS